MSDLLLEYKAYYSVRAERYADNPKYSNSYAAEKNLSDAMQSCNELKEFRDKMGDLNEKCAIALIKDEHLMEKEFYEKHKEDVRVLAAKRILEKLPQCHNTTELTTLVLDETNKNSVEISMDLYQREFQGDWGQLDSIEIFENAVVPSEYKSNMMETADDIKKRVVESAESTEKEGQKFDPNFRFNPEINKEHRHRRIIPYSDQHLEEQLQKYKSLINR